MKQFALTTLLLPLALALAAQVGVNNADPEQALDVGGKVKIADDGETPTEGTLRYNAADGDFEGYTDQGWEDLNNAPVNAAPADPLPVFASVFTTFQNEGYIVMEYMDVSVPGVPTPFLSAGGRDNTIVPPGKILVIDNLHAVGMSTTADEQFLIQVAATTEQSTDPAGLSSGRIEPLVYVTGSVKGGAVVLGGGKAPLLVLPAGQQLTLLNESAASATGGVRVVMTGMLVDSMADYYAY